MLNIRKNAYKITKNIILFYFFRKKEQANAENILILHVEYEDCTEYSGYKQNSTYIWQKN